MEHIRLTTARLLNQSDPIKYYQNRLGGMRGKPSGINGWYQWNSLCPFHADKRSGSFYVNIQNGAFMCHSCGAKGGSLASFERLFNYGR